LPPPLSFGEEPIRNKPFGQLAKQPGSIVKNNPEPVWPGTSFRALNYKIGTVTYHQFAWEVMSQHQLRSVPRWFHQSLLFTV
jgi:hypothetical protein